MSGLYVHVPFCASRCPYCAFVSIASPPPRLTEAYVEAIGKELEIPGPGRKDIRETLYIGGGTPTHLTSKMLELLISNILIKNTFSDSFEATIEATPRSLDAERLAALSAGGINRLSLGVQSFSDGTLRALGRTHDAAEGRRALEKARNAGVENIGIDLIYGAPGQTPADWRRDLLEALALSPEHISLYGLSVEEDTRFFELSLREELPLPAEGDALDMYRLACDLLGTEGYRHYEISNWAQPGRECRHNMDCWRLVPYDGVGAAAHGFRRDPAPLRYGNVENVEAYIDLVGRGVSPRAFEEPAEGNRLAGEAAMLGLRVLDGIDREDYRTDFGSLPEELFPEAFGLGFSEGWLEEKRGRIRLTFAGIIFSNEIFQLLF
jgi:oxygen-independent coproporphyrinogen-3 oxidase